MRKVCVFCGERAESKTSEHVLPQWLIELTGDPKRTTEFGYQHLENGELAKRKFSFAAFKFPACKSCNQSFAALEAETKSIVTKLVNEESLSELEFNILFDWFDKIRIGLWLGYRYLDKNAMAIEPHYYINSRIGQHDRMLLILKADDKRQGLSFVGCDTPSFALTPSCFSLRINNFCFLNMSYPDLLCRRIGFPYPLETYMMEDERLFCRFVKGRNRIMRPVLKKVINIQGTELYQPIFAGNIGSTDNTVTTKLYDTEYVRDNCISWEKGIGKVFIKNDSRLNLYSKESSKEWVPNRSYSFEDLLFDLQILTLDWQLYIDSLRPSMKLLSKEKKNTIIRKRKLSKWYNEEIMRILRIRA